MRGVVIGKFLPLHLGHVLLLETAAGQCDQLTVIVCDAGWHELPVSLRVAWVRESVPGAQVLSVDQDRFGLSDDDSAGWAGATTALLGGTPDIVFTSEDYGPTYAGHLGARHVMVDRARERRPVSGTAVRADPLSHLDLLPPQVRAHYVRRVCILGAESTGKTTLAADLGARLNATVVPEFGRFYTEAMPHPGRYRWSSEDFETIARVQASFEDDAARWCGPVLICDTNPFVTSVFREVYLGAPDAELADWTAKREYDLFLLCDPDTPFEQDATGLRNDGEVRRRMHSRYAEYAGSRGPVVEVGGDRKVRVDKATAAIEATLAAAPRSSRSVAG